ncbi:hypothetical protein V5799_020804 [Amblyomma americanum]|uniref:Uncharacterized protein n=1 Tax=Amblyomma americanum TaxID=6943 RepID=A0AAQ4ET92_AMBAM
MALKKIMMCCVTYFSLSDEHAKSSWSGSADVCRYVTRLQECLSSSLEGTECVGESSVNAQLKVYKRVLQDAYSLNCDTSRPKEVKAGRQQHTQKKADARMSNKKSAFRMGKDLRQNALRRYLDKNARMSKQTGGRGSYDEDDDYELISKRQKPVFMSPAGKLMEEPDGFRDDDSYELVRSDGYQYHDLNRKNQRELEDYEDFADLEPDVRPRAGRKSHRRHRKLRNRDGKAKKLVVDSLVASKARHSKRDKRRKLAYEDEYFFDNEPEEESVISGLPENMAMFQHIKHRPEMNVERLLSGNVTTNASITTDMAGRKRHF